MELEVVETVVEGMESSMGGAMVGGCVGSRGKVFGRFGSVWFLPVVEGGRKEVDDELSSHENVAVVEE